MNKVIGGRRFGMMARAAAVFALCVMSAVFCVGCGGDNGTNTEGKNDGDGGGGGIPTPTKTTFTDSRDGMSYKKVTIGTQTWMAENLNYNTSESVCYNNSANCGDGGYGRLYTWADAMVACPAGWHLPSDAEWTTLTNYVGGKNTASKKLKLTSGWYDSYGNPGNGTDDYGFSAISGGYGLSYGEFKNIRSEGYWWSATELIAEDAWIRYMRSNDESVLRNGVYKLYLFSVRCLQDP